MPYLNGRIWEAIGLTAILAYTFVTFYIYAPLKVKRNQRRSALATYTPIDLSALPETVSYAFVAASRWLAADGFRSVGTATRAHPENRQNSFVSLWINAEQKDTAQIIGILTPSPMLGVRVVTLVTFRTEFTNGTAIVTSNSSSSGCFPQDAKVSSVRCPDVSDLSLLYRFHRARIKRDRGSRTATLDRFTTVPARVQLEHDETYGRLIKAGYYRLDEESREYVPTLKGCCLMTWRLLPPWKQYRLLTKDTAANRALRATGFGNLAAFRQSQAHSPRPVTQATAASLAPQV